MDDFRKQLTELVDSLMAEGRPPIFLIIDLVGAEEIKRARDTQSLGSFREMVMGSLAGASGGDAFSYGDYRVVGVLPGFDRLKTFALVEKMRRTIPLLAQSFDCIVYPDFDTVEYEDATGVPGVIAQLVKPRDPNRDAA